VDPSLITTVGFPIAIVLGIGMAIVRSARWAAPRVDEIKNVHIRHVQASSDANAIHAEANQRNSQCMEKIATAVERDAESLAKMASTHQSLERAISLLAGREERRRDDQQKAEGS